MNVSDKYLRDLLREVVSRRAGGRCEFPDCHETACDPHHAESKKNTAVRWDADACINLCTGHHTGETISAHRSPLFFKTIIIESGVRTAEWFGAVRQKANVIIKDSEFFRIEMKEKLQNELRRNAA